MRRSTRAVLVGATAIAAVCATTGVADAHIVWTAGESLSNHHTGGCLSGDYQTLHANMAVCGNDTGNGEQDWVLISVQPDTHGYANVEIKLALVDDCLVAYAHGTGPSQISGSSDVELAPCNANDPSQIWAMTTAAPRSGVTAHLNFFTFGQRACLDGGIGAYAFPESGCNQANDYQEWDYDHGQYNDDGSPT